MASRLQPVLLAVPSGSAALSRRLLLIALPEPQDDFDVLKILLHWVREVVF